jgi:uncharacterized membrane protein YdjX (TVP38/TMEM64 family)
MRDTSENLRRTDPGVRRLLLIGMWLLLVSGSLYLYIFHRESIRNQLNNAFSLSILVACLIYLLLGSLRAFTLIPSSFLVLAALAFFPTPLLFVLTLIGILISSSVIYYFAESLQIAEAIERRHATQLARVKSLLARNELAIIIGWSFFPLAPTDVICYVCGIMEVNFRKFLFGVCLGEGTICAIYIFLGDHVWRFLRLK